MTVLNETSLYPVVVFGKPEDWAELLRLCSPFLVPADWVKLKELLASSAKSVIVEREYIDKDYRDTYSGFYSKKFAEYPSRTIRLHFFGTALKAEDIWELENFEQDYIGYCVVRPTRVTSIGRTILDPAKIEGLPGTMCLTEFKAHLLGTELSVKGFPHISQDTDVTICAHAACWMIFRYYSERYPNYRETYPFQITQMTTDISTGRLIPSRGLNVGQISQIFSDFGFYPEIYSRDKFTQPGLFDRLLYYYVESGLPVVCGLATKFGVPCMPHALVTFGHISDYQIQPPPANPIFRSSYGYLKGFVVNNDNHMPYQVMSLSRDGSRKHRSEYGAVDVAVFVVPMYEKIYLAAEHVERSAQEILLDRDIGIDALSPSLSGQDLIARIFLTSSKSYKKVRKATPLPHSIERLYAQLPMPKFIWICELSTTALYPQGQILGELIWDATASQYDQFPFIVVHYPDYIIVNNRDAMTAAKDRFVIMKKLDEPRPYELYRNNLKECQ
ncbi:hypothetical protein J7M28_13575 [bacterium]|nr:hypothetical protein [bacterium]